MILNELVLDKPMLNEEFLNTSIHKGQTKKIIPLKRANLSYLSGTEVCFLHREFAKYSTEF